MKKNEMKRLALLGVTAGILMANQSGLQAVQDENTIDLENVIAKPKCKAHGGCGGLTASRDLNSALIQDDEELDGQEADLPEGSKPETAKPDASKGHENPKELA